MSGSKGGGGAPNTALSGATPVHHDNTWMQYVGEAAGAVLGTVFAAPFGGSYWGPIAGKMAGSYLGDMFAGNTAGEQADIPQLPMGGGAGGGMLNTPLSGVGGGGGMLP